MSNAADARPDDAVFDRRDWLQITLASIGDGVITADADGRVNYLNPVAETAHRLDARRGGRAVEVERVFRIVNETTRQPVEQPVRKVIERGLTVGLGNHTLLIATGRQRAAHRRQCRRHQGRRRRRRRGRPHLPRHHRTPAGASGSSSRPGRTPRASSPPCGGRSWSSTASSTSGRRTAPSTRPSGSPRRDRSGRFIYDLGDGQWDIPALRTLLEDIVPANSVVRGFRGGARLRAHRPEDDAPERPPLPARRASSS